MTPKMCTIMYFFGDFLAVLDYLFKNSALRFFFSGIFSNICTIFHISEKNSHPDLLYIHNEHPRKTSTGI